MDLSNEVALVTGGSRNIGLAIARALGASGARICIWGGSDAVALDKALSLLNGDEESRIGMLVKVEDEDAVVDAFDQIEAHMGPVSILVNNAALRPYEPLNSMSREAWTSVLDVILTGAFLTSRGIVPAIARRTKWSDRKHRRHQRASSSIEPGTRDHSESWTHRPDTGLGPGRPRAHPGQLRGTRRYQYRNPAGWNRVHGSWTSRIMPQVTLTTSPVPFCHWQTPTHSM